MGKVEHRILLVRSGEPNEVVEHLGHTEGRQRQVGEVEERPDLARGSFSLGPEDPERGSPTQMAVFGP